MTSRLNTRIERLDARETPKSSAKLPLADFRHLAEGLFRQKNRGDGPRSLRKLPPMQTYPRTRKLANGMVRRRISGCTEV
jgi:hypothetical protein